MSERERRGDIDNVPITNGPLVGKGPAPEIRPPGALRKLREKREFERFFSEVAERGLAASSGAEHKGMFSVPVGSEVGTTLYIEPDPKKVYEVLEMARAHGHSETYGPHVGLLNLVARRSDIEAGCSYPQDEVSWHVAQPVGVPPDNLVSLRGWLTEEGYDIDLGSL